MRPLVGSPSITPMALGERRMRSEPRHHRANERPAADRPGLVRASSKRGPVKSTFVRSPTGRIYPALRRSALNASADASASSLP